MATTLTDCEVYYNALVLGGDLNELVLGSGGASLDETRFGDWTRARKGGLRETRVSGAGFWRDDAAPDSALVAAIGVDDPRAVLSIYAEGGAVGNVAHLLAALALRYRLGERSGALLPFSMAAEGDVLDRGISLYPYSTVGANTSGASVDNAAATANGGVAHFHVFLAAGVWNMRVEHSTDDAVWTTLAEEFAVTVGAYRLAVSGDVNRYVRSRVIRVTASGRLTFTTAFARR